MNKIEVEFAASCQTHFHPGSAERIPVSAALEMVAI